MVVELAGLGLSCPVLVDRLPLKLLIQSSCVKESYWAFYNAEHEPVAELDYRCATKEKVGRTYCSNAI
jgi:hypothetical protein